MPAIASEFRRKPRFRSPCNAAPSTRSPTGLPARIGSHAPPHPDPGAVPHAASAPHRSCGSSRASACSRVRSSGGISFGSEA